MQTAEREAFIRKWGNNLGVRFVSDITKAADFDEHTTVKVTAQRGRIVLEAVGKRRLSLDEKLARFDKARHGGETMAFTPVGRELA